MYQVQVAIAVGRKIYIARTGYGDIIFGTVAIDAIEVCCDAITVGLFYQAVDIVIGGGVAFVFWPVRDKIQIAIGRNKGIGIGIKRIEQWADNGFLPFIVFIRGFENDIFPVMRAEK